MTSADTLASRLVLARQRAGLSLGQVARMLRDHGYTAEDLGDFESADCTPQRADLARLADLYGVSVDWLLHGATPERIAWAEAQVPATIPADDRAKVVDLFVSFRSGDADNA